MCVVVASSLVPHSAFNLSTSEISVAEATAAHYFSNVEQNVSQNVSQAF